MIINSGYATFRYDMAAIMTNVHLCMCNSKTESENDALIVKFQKALIVYILKINNNLI